MSKKYRLTTIIVFTISVVLCISSCAAPNIPVFSPSKTATPAPTATPIPSPTPEPTLPPEREGIEDLKNQLSSYIDTFNGDWGVYVKNLSTNEYITINEHEMYSASLIKLFVMAAVYREIENGTIQQDDNINHMLNLMITDSDNNCANELCNILGSGDMLKGFEIENANTKTLDCTYTLHQTDLQDNRADSKIPYIGRNYTSPRDCGHVLELIYRSELVNKQFSDEMLDLLKNQHRRYKIPASLPEDIVTANKTGETSSIENDAAIVYSPSTDYIITIMSNDVPNTDTAIEHLQQISSDVYSYFNP